MQKDSFVKKFDRDIPSEGDIAGFGCNLCDWTSKKTQLFRALEDFGQHNADKHSNTLSAHITYIYNPQKSKNAPNSLWRK